MPGNDAESSLTLNLSRQNAQLSARDKVDNWDYESDHEDWPEPDAACEINIHASDTTLPESLAEFQSHEAFLLESAEYKWLRHQLETLTSLDHVGKTLWQVQHTLLSAMPDVRRLVSVSNVELRLMLDWHPMQFLEEQFPSATTLPPLASVITICGSSSKPYASTCGDYIMQTWPIYGKRALSMAQTCIDEALDGPKIPMRIMVPQSEFRMFGSQLEVLEMAEVLIWLAVACQSASSLDSMQLCEPELRQDEASATIAFHLQLRKSNIVFNEEASCWRKMFKNPVIALGYPVPVRAYNEVGLEMSAQMLPVLGRTTWATIFEGGLVLKGFSTMLVAVNRISSSVLWHFMSKANGERIAYHDRGCKAGLQSVSEAFLTGNRHFVAWTATAALRVGEWTAFVDRCCRTRY